MFCKLALGNVRRSFRDYGVYLLTLTFGVCLFYTFNSVEDQGAILYLREKSHETVRPSSPCLASCPFLWRWCWPVLFYTPTGSSSAAGKRSWAAICCWA